MWKRKTLEIINIHLTEIMPERKGISRSLFCHTGQQAVIGYSKQQCRLSFLLKQWLAPNFVSWTYAEDNWNRFETNNQRGVFSISWRFKFLTIPSSDGDETAFVETEFLKGQDQSRPRPLAFKCKWDRVLTNRLSWDQDYKKTSKFSSQNHDFIIPVNNQQFDLQIKWKVGLCKK